MNIRIFKCLIFLLFLIITNPAVSQTLPQTPPQTIPNTYTDTLRLTLDSLEKMFLQKNYQLLAQKYNVDAQRALVLQAKLFNNPTLYYENSIYNRTSHQFFPAQGGIYNDQNNSKSEGEFVWNIEWMVSLAGKRRKNVQIARTNTEISEYTFFDLMRNLKYELRSDFITLYYLEQSLSLYDQEIKSLDQTIQLYDKQFNKGNIPLIELERLKAFQISLESEQRNIATQIAAQQNNLMIFVSIKGYPYFIPQLNKNITDSINFKQLTVTGLVDSAYAGRYDVKIGEKTIQLNTQNLELQRITAIPDVQFGTNADLNGSYIQHYQAANISFALPVLNQNQGNIRAARYQISVAQANFDAIKLQVDKDVWQAYTQLLLTQNQFGKLDSKFITNYQKLKVGVSESYQKRNISTLQFLDFYESYKTSVLEYNQLQSDRLTAIENLNLAIGKTLYNY